jgi:D-alanine-D-alanine ligase-like ATP-grasp enzyme
VQHAGANNICLNKEVTKAFLRAKGFPVARSDMFSTQEEEDAVRYTAFLGYPDVLKRLAGMGGSGVWPHIQNETEFKAVWAAHLESKYRYMVEKHVFGDDYRFLVADGAVIAVLNRQPPSTIGDGVKATAELVAARDNRMSTNNVVHKRIPVDESLQVLAQQGFSRSYVPANGERILLRSAAVISSGGDGIDPTEVTPDSYKELAIACVQAAPELRSASTSSCAISNPAALRMIAPLWRLTTILCSRYIISLDRKATGCSENGRRNTVGHRSGRNAGAMVSGMPADKAA